MTALIQAFRDQGKACRALGSPFMGQLFDILAENWPVGSDLARKCTSFRGDPGPGALSLPLRIAGGLHALALKGHALREVYPPKAVLSDVLKDAVLGAVSTEAAFLCDWIESPPQTNEIRRSAALIPAASVAVARFGLPIHLSELGASGGLNLLWDRFALELGGTRHFGPRDAVVTLRPDWTGPVPADMRPVVLDRRGVDLNPLDPGKPDDLLRLTAFLWPDQPERLKMTRAAAAAGAAPVDRGDAIDWLAQRLATTPPGYLHLLQNTIAWQYFPPKSQARGIDLIEAAGAKATADRPLAWIALENDGDASGQGGAALTLRLWPGNETLLLGRADFHGRWVRWN